MDKKQIKQLVQLEKQQKKLEEKTRKKHEAEEKKAANKTRKLEVLEATKGRRKNAEFSGDDEVVRRKLQEAAMKKQDTKQKKEAEKIQKKAEKAAQKEVAKTLKKQAVLDKKGSVTKTRKRRIKIIEGPPINIPFSVLPEKKPSPIKLVKLDKKLKKKNIKILGEISKEEAFEMFSVGEDGEKLRNLKGRSQEKFEMLTDSDIIITKINEFKTKGISVLDHVNEKTLTKMIEVANTYYYNETPLLNDNEFDIIKEYMERKYPKNQVLAAVGAPITITKNKVTLPYEMASMDKIKPDSGALAQWKQKYKGPYVLSCKLDGVSGMYVKGTDKGTENGKSEAKLYTRGDGKVGQDITHIINAIQLPKMNHTDGIIAVRGEFIIPKKIFDEKYKATFANPRNLVSGIINSKTIDDKTRDLHFVTYEVVHPPMKPSEQMTKLTTLTHEVVMHRTIPNQEELTNEMLSELLLDWRKNYEYEIDGIIVTDDNVYPRKSGNPDHAFAFKMVISDQMAEAKVVDVIWTPSKNGYLKPRVRIEPIKLGGVTIEYATGFNGKFIQDWYWCPHSTCAQWGCYTLY